MADERPPDIPRNEERPNLGKLLARPYLALSAALDERLSAAGYGDVRAAHGVVFAVIDAEGSRVTDLAARAGMTKQAMAELVAHLEDARLRPSRARPGRPARAHRPADPARLGVHRGRARHRRGAGGRARRALGRGADGRAARAAGDARQLLAPDRSRTVAPPA